MTIAVRELEINPTYWVTVDGVARIDSALFNTMCQQNCYNRGKCCKCFVCVLYFYFLENISPFYDGATDTPLLDFW